MGDSIHAAVRQKVHFTLRMVALQNAYPQVIEDGRPTELIDKTARAEPDETEGFDYISDGQRHWFRVNVRSTSGALLIIGNPIYLNFDESK
jgi:hypothetical protein